MAKLLRVFYGWAKINKIRKKEAISVIFENDGGFEKNEKKVKLYQNTVYTRFQTKKEMEDAEMSNRTFSEYSIFLDDKQIKGSLKKALEVNFLADKKNVAKEVREEIRRLLEKDFLLNHRNYKEPRSFQTSLFFE
ncbi:hypothetical protein [Prevotella pallens]|jgi:hypothetical protein|uniref:hypothetical protein n=1 Tax=Prevotella pallens TaxID=60133 RepID=UPI00288C3698|nr:hypothetical protein [Prevotella pallens]